MQLPLKRYLRSAYNNSAHTHNNHKINNRHMLRNANTKLPNSFRKKTSLHNSRPNQNSRQHKHYQELNQNKFFNNNQPKRNRRQRRTSTSSRKLRQSAMQRSVLGQANIQRAVENVATLSLRPSLFSTTIDTSQQTLPSVRQARLSRNT